MARRSDAEMLMDHVPEEGSGVGNEYLIKQLGWQRDKYWKVRDELLDRGVIERGKGRGGSVRRSTSKVPAVAAKKVASTGPEEKLYQPLLGTLQSDWVREMRIEPDQIHFEITAKQGKKATGGTWTRPDITAVSVRTFQHIPGKYVDVWTFEVKSLEALDVTAIFEAASHASRATRSYALLQVPNGPSDAVGELLDRCVSEAARLKVGLITFSSASDWSTWETKVEAPRLETAPELLDEFVNYLPNAAKIRISKWK